MKKLILIFMLLVSMLCACGNSLDANQDNSVEDPLPPENADVEKPLEGDMVMNERLITKDELFEYIQTHEVGLTVDDFDGIDVDDFIKHFHFTPSNIEFLWEKTLEGYLEDLELDERKSYFAKSIVSVESTEEEFQEFIKSFSRKIGKKIVFSGTSDGFVFIDINDTAQTTLYIAQTKDIYELNIFFDDRHTPDLLTVFIENGPDGAGTRGNLCYNKNQKYMLLAYPYEDRSFEYVKVFCGLEG